MPEAPDGTVEETPAHRDDLGSPGARPWERPGPVLAPFWVQFWVHFGCFLGATTEDVFWQFLYPILGVIWQPFGIQNWVI